MRIPGVDGCGIATATGTYKGKMQLIDNQVDARSGTVRVRAVFDNADGGLMPGQFARAADGTAQGRAGAADQRTRRRHRPEEEIRDGRSPTRTARRNIAKVALGVSIEGMRVGDRRAARRRTHRGQGLQRVRPGAPEEEDALRWWRWVLLLPRPRWRSASSEQDQPERSTGKNNRGHLPAAKKKKRAFAGAAEVMAATLDRIERLN